MFPFLTSTAPQVTVQTLKEILDRNDQVVLLDVRTVGEFERANIHGSVNLPLDLVQQKISTLVPNKDSRIYVYCLSGSRSVVAVEMLQKLGYTQVFDVKQGLLAWRVAHYPVVS